MSRLHTIYDWRPELDKNPERRPERYGEIRDRRFWDLFELVRPFTMLAIETLYDLYRSVVYVVEHRIPGRMVECGCFLGGASMLMALLTRELGDERPVTAFDTFAGFPEGQRDVHSITGIEYEGPRYSSFLDNVRANVALVTGAAESVELVEGDVAETLPRSDVGPISLLRLDTDYYESTRLELELLYPLLSPGGVLVIDDYGAYEGSRRATDEYFTRHPPRPLLHRIDAGVRSGIKT